MLIIDFASWNRRKIFSVYSAMGKPFYSVTVQTDVTGLYRQAKARNQSFFAVCLYAVQRTANKIENFRYRVLANGRLVQHQRMDTVYRALRSDGQATMVRVGWRSTLEGFIAEKSRLQDEALAQEEPQVCLDSHRGYILADCLPWYSFTAADFACDTGKRYDSIPRFLWGKAAWSQDRLMMPLAIQAHHGFVDETDLAQFFEIFPQCPME